MKRNTDYPEYQEHKSFRLSNEQRPYFGLDKIDEIWDEVEIKEGTTVFYDGNTIRKIITWENFRRYDYTEFDTELHTRDRQFVLPKTEKGKEKKITPTNLLGFMPTGCKVSITLKSEHHKSYVSAFCQRNNIWLPITEDEDISTITDLKAWLNNYLKTCPPDYFDKVNRMRTLSHRTVKYKVGDIFRFEIDRENYGFGLIIGKLRDLEKLGVFCEDHPMHSVMTVPIFVRLYKIKTKNKDLPVNEIVKNSLLATDLMSDNDIIWGTHEIIGSKDLEENDIDFPMHYGYLVNSEKKRMVRLSWGIGMVKTEDIGSLPEELITTNFTNSGVALSLPIYALIRALQGQYEHSAYGDLRHPDNIGMKQKVFELFRIPTDIDMDTFNKKYNGMTRKQYIDYLISIK